MHIIGVMYIQELLKKPKVRILDVGCGSGFVTAVLALAAQDPEIVLGVDHIEEFVQKGYQLIEWFVPQLSNRISFRQLDARFGCGEDKFDIIHLGASPNSIAELEPIIDNLKVGGKLIGPVTLHGYQRFVLITKNRSGYSVNELFDVRYTTLQDIQSQISQ